MLDCVPGRNRHTVSLLPRRSDLVAFHLSHFHLFRCAPRAHHNEHRIVSFGKQAEFTLTLTKGSYVLVQCAVRTREYEGDCVKRRVVEVRADTVGKLDHAEAPLRSRR